MPRRVDHRERRELLADALMRLAAARGLEGVSLRQVAAEAGVSTGMVQHYFRTKDEMMTFALAMVMDRVRERSGAELTSTAPRELVRGLLCQVLPLDETRRLENHVVLAFLAYAAVKPSIAAGLREAAAQTRTFLAEQLRAAGPPAGVDPDRAAAGLLALVDGLGLQLLSSQYTEEAALAALDAQLTLLFGA
ncbi:TetR family transcriptional regulator C-terminal domain-containing protein [Streptomyces sp. DSM 44915]|uniref:TetR family transcriptional regulator C-terminal domain-containing protein n=1 Tax=Streptomyces chisholmiae TaxID=3075540 RepID=A0ABU2JQT7_9ACTN|nr:TetR family transcriptional regulator C-terminal domain-containing protein [Streptomyces sp. DSM 44915]MDT0267277.1 TetR family transcriptional regulator C-terminal domain-containing protein [Streptomyces sp. DSM 44915]